MAYRVPAYYEGQKRNPEREFAPGNLENRITSTAGTFPRPGANRQRRHDVRTAEAACAEQSLSAGRRAMAVLSPRSASGVRMIRLLPGTQDRVAIT
mgnify:CR=1 FL=1